MLETGQGCNRCSSQALLKSYAYCWRAHTLVGIYKKPASSLCCEYYYNSIALSQESILQKRVEFQIPNIRV